jgi:heme oxygenase
MTTPKLGTSFIEPHRDDPNAWWRDYARLLVPLSTTANVEKTIVDGAVTTFNALQNWIIEGASALRLWCALSRDRFLRAPSGICGSFQ